MVQLVVAAAGGNPHAFLSFSDGYLSEVRLRLCNFSREHAGKDLLSVREDMASCATSVLGEPSGKQDGNAFWELENRGLLWIKVLEATVLLQVLHPRYADIERAEGRLGIPRPHPRDRGRGRLPVARFLGR